MLIYKEQNKIIIQDKTSEQFGVVYLTKKQALSVYKRLGKMCGIRDYQQEVKDKVL